MLVMPRAFNFVNGSGHGLPLLSAGTGRNVTHNETGGGELDQHAGGLADGGVPFDPPARGIGRVAGDTRKF